MQPSAIFDTVPLWVLSALTVMVILLSTEAGWRLGNYRRQRLEREKEAPVGVLVRATDLGFSTYRTWRSAAGGSRGVFSTRAEPACAHHVGRAGTDHHTPAATRPLPGRSA